MADIVRFTEQRASAQPVVFRKKFWLRASDASNVQFNSTANLGNPFNSTFLRWTFNNPPFTTRAKLARIAGVYGYFTASSSFAGPVIGLTCNFSLFDYGGAFDNRVSAKVGSQLGPHPNFWVPIDLLTSAVFGNGTSYVNWSNPTEDHSAITTNNIQELTMYLYADDGTAPFTNNNPLSADQVQHLVFELEFIEVVDSLSGNPYSTQTIRT